MNLNSRLTVAPAWSCRAVAMLALGCLMSAQSDAGQEAARAAVRAESAPPGAGLFTNGPTPQLCITLAAADLSRLRQDSREDVPALVRDGAETFQRVAVHLKGSTGSFRSLDDKPALTLDFGKFIAGQRFHGLRKIHLNNSVEDPSYFNELAGSELFRAAGVPAPRVTHAGVELNGRRLGLYVLKEGFATELLGLHFQRTNGNLYDTGPGHDVDEALARDQGDGPDDRSDLRTLTAAAREVDLTQRWQALDQVLDLNRFVSFMAMEVIACHRDGYCLARNNFRVYHDPGSDRMVFLPHGMDQLFGRSDATLRPAMSGLLARAVMETPEGRRQYRERLAFLTTNVFDVSALRHQGEDFLKRTRPVLTDREFRELEQAIAGFNERMARRKQFLERQLRELEPAPLPFQHAVAKLAGWQAVDAPRDGKLDLGLSPDGRNALHLRAGALTSASWRTKVLLPKGRYRFEAAALTKAVKPLSFGNNQGAGLRVVGGTPSSPYQLTGNHAWTSLERLFEVEGQREVELICELRAAAGEVWFDLDSLRLVQLR